MKKKKKVPLYQVAQNAPDLSKDAFEIMPLNFFQAVRRAQWI